MPTHVSRRDQRRAEGRPGGQVNATPGCGASMEMDFITSTCNPPSLRQPLNLVFRIFGQSLPISLIMGNTDGSPPLDRTWGLNDERRCKQTARRRNLDSTPAQPRAHGAPVAKTYPHASATLQPCC
jgi:hypothetical protein